MELQSSLEQLDLNKNEAKVYLELLKLGLTNAGPLVSATRLHRQLVYEALDRLIEKKLASILIKNNRKHFQAASPNVILKLIQDKEARAREILPELLKLRTQADDQIEIRTLYGQKGFIENLRTIIRSASTDDGIMRIIGGAPDTKFYEVLGEMYPTYVKLLEDNKVKKYLISPEEYSKEFKRKFALEEGNILKTLNKGMSSPTYTRITKDMVSIEIYAGEVVIVQIFNKAIAKSYRENFDLLWEQAELFKPNY